MQGLGAVPRDEGGGGGEVVKNLDVKEIRSTQIQRPEPQLLRGAWLSPWRLPASLSCPRFGLVELQDRAEDDRFTPYAEDPLKLAAVQKQRGQTV